MRRAGVPVVRRAWSATTTSVVVVLVAGVLAGLVYGAWASRHQTWSATTTFQVFPQESTGDPDRVIATQIDVLESRTQREDVVGRLTSPADLSISAAQRRLSNVLEVTATSPDQTTATLAAAGIAKAYPPQAAAAVPLLVRVTVLDPPLAATPTDDALRDALLVGLGGAALAVAALLLFFSLRPRVKRSYTAAPADAVMLELPVPGRRDSLRRTDLASELRRFADHVIALRGGHGRAHLRVSALPGVDDATVGWVTDVLSETSATLPEPTALHGRPDHDGRSRGALAVRAGSEVVLADGVMPAALDDDRPFSVLVARAGVDSEIDLRREVGSRAVFSDVMVVLLGSSRPALVLPGSAQGGGHGRRVDDGRHRSHRASATVWR